MRTDSTAMHYASSITDYASCITPSGSPISIRIIPMRTFTRRFRVRHYELDFLGHLNNAVYIRLMQEAAIEASTEAGYSPQWYRDHGTGWVIRRLQIRYHAQARYGDELEITTWVSDLKRVSSHREYQITRLSDGARVAQARV